VYAADRSEVLIELIHRVLRDTPSGRVDAAVLYGQTKENEGVMLDALADAYWEGLAEWLALPDFEGLARGELMVSSFEAWEDLLCERGVPRDMIISYPTATDVPPSTDAEAKGLVRFAKERGWASVAIVVPPLHAVRAFVSTIAPVVREYPELRVYSAPSVAPSWAESVFHSGSMPRARRADHIAGEFEKMERYQKQGSHLSPQEVLDYLNWRDSQ
jgi:hypothetical protein